MVSLKKESYTREYTPEHLMDEEEAVRRFCPPRDESVNKAEISIKKSESNELEKAAQGENTESPLTDSDEGKGGTAFNILINIICILCFVAGFSAIIYALYICIDGIQGILRLMVTDTTDTIATATLANSLMKPILIGVVGCAMITTSRLIKKLFDGRRW